MWHEGLGGHSHKATGTMCMAWKWYAVIFDDTASVRFYSGLNHKRAHTQESSACCKQCALCSPVFGHYYIECGLPPHASRRRKQISVSRTFWYMRNKHNSGQRCYVGYFLWLHFCCLFHVSPRHQFFCFVLYIFILLRSI